MKVYKQKVKHLLYEHQNNITELKQEGECSAGECFIRMFECLYYLGAVAITLEQNQHKEREAEMKSDKRALKIEIKEMELAHEEMVKNLQKVNIIIHALVAAINLLLLK